MSHTAPTIDSLLRSTWEQYRKDFSFNLQVVLRFLFSYLILFIPDIVNFFGQREQRIDALFITCYIIGYCTLIYTSITASYAILQKENGVKISHFGLTVGTSRFWPALGTALMLGLGMVAIMVLGLLAVGILSSIYPVLAITLIALYILLFIWIIWLSIRLTFAIMVSLDEKVWGVAALKKSANLVKGRWWDVFMKMMVPSLILFLALFLSTMLMLAITGINLADFDINSIDKLTVGIGGVWLFYIALTLLSVPAQVIYATKVYKSLV